MTNSKLDKPSETISTVETTTPVIAGKYVSDKDTVFEVAQAPNGLYHIVMKKGGAAPPMCNDFYTSHQLAEKDLILYLKQRDRLGYAVYPGKGD